MKSASGARNKRSTFQQKTLNDISRERPMRQDFDEENGQVYHEVEVAFKRRQNSDWIGEYRNPSILAKTRRSESSSRSLLDIAKSKCVGEFRNFTPAHFQSIPWTLASKLWDEVVSTHSESFHAWRVMASAYNNEDEFGARKRRYHLEIKQPPLHTQDYFKGLSPTKAEWLSALRISPKQISIADLVAVANIRNLCVLDLSDGQILLDIMASRFEERIMRTWAELASSGKAFQHLRALLLGWQDGVGDWIFKYLTHFPRLRYIIMTDCRDMHQKNRTDWEDTAHSYGWTAHHAKRSVKLLRPLLDDRSFHTTSISALYYHSHEQSEQMVGNPATYDTGSMKPVVECWLGTPRRWTHILDEFPGTRTVWFEKSSKHNEMAEPDSVKRLRETGSPVHVLTSPPRKKPHGQKEIRMRAPAKSAADLLADMGM